MSLSTDGLTAPVTVTPMADVLAALVGAEKPARATRVMRGRPATTAAVQPFAHVDDLVDAPTQEQLASRLSDADRVRLEEMAREGYDEGFRQGHTAGLAQARAEFAARTQGALAALAGAADGLRARDAVALDELDGQIVDFAVDVAEAIVGVTMAAGVEPGRDAIARAIGFVPDRGSVLVRLHPADLATLADVSDLAPGRDLQFVADAGVQPGGCVLEVGACRVDAQVGPALERVRAALAPGNTGGLNR